MADYRHPVRFRGSASIPARRTSPPRCPSPARPTAFGPGLPCRAGSPPTRPATWTAWTMLEPTLLARTEGGSPVVLRRPRPAAPPAGDHRQGRGVAGRHGRGAVYPARWSVAAPARAGHRRRWAGSRAAVLTWWAFTGRGESRSSGGPLRRGGGPGHQARITNIAGYQARPGPAGAGWRLGSAARAPGCSPSPERASRRLGSAR